MVYVSNYLNVRMFRLKFSNRGKYVIHEKRNFENHSTIV